MEADEYHLQRRVEDTHWWFGGLHALAADQLARAGARLDDGRILDAGCGTGALLGLGGPAALMLGLDISPIALHLGRDRPFAQWVRGDVVRLPFANSAFDLALCSNVIYHRQVPDPLEALREIVRVLRPGGHLFLVVPSSQIPWSRHDERVHGTRRFSLKEVRELLKESGLTIHRLSAWTSLLYPLIWFIRRFHLLAEGRDFEVRPTLLYRGMERVLSGCMAVERHLLRRVSLPFGVSVFAVAHKPVPAASSLRKGGE